jgi:hypothetical protein
MKIFTRKNYSFITTVKPLVSLLFLSFAIFQPRVSANAQTNGTSRLSIQLLLNNTSGSSNTADGCLLLFSDNFTRGLGSEDSYKFNNLDENLAIDCRGTSLSIEGRPTIQLYDTVPLKMWQFRQSDYLLKLVGTNFPASVAAVLKDNYLKVDQPIDLASSTTINFNITSDSASVAADRFCLVFKPVATLPLSLLSFKGFAKGNAVQLMWTMADETNIDRCEVESSADGLKFRSVATVPLESVNGNAYNWLDIHPAQGNNYYRIKVFSKSGEFVQSQVVKVSMQKIAETVSIFPNPAKGNNLGIRLSNFSAGNYTVQLISNTGQLIAGSLINVNSSLFFYKMKADNIARGIYFLKVFGNGSFYNTSVIVN